MESFSIEGGIPLRGEVTPSGNKNAALPLLCAAILTDEPVILHNVPMIRDVIHMRRLIESLGVTFEELMRIPGRCRQKMWKPRNWILTYAGVFARQFCWQGRCVRAAVVCCCPLRAVM